MLETGLNLSTCNIVFGAPRPDTVSFEITVSAIDLTPHTPAHPRRLGTLVHNTSTQIDRYTQSEWSAGAYRRRNLRTPLQPVQILY
jgi:hypothetical protein